MRRVLIIEDELPASKRLKGLIQKLSESIEIVDILDSVEDAVAWFNNFDHPDLVFMDIQLSDGHSMDILDQVKVQCPIIFTTAFDQYAIKAFKYNAVDYLLKPVDPKELQQAWNKFEDNFGKQDNNLSEIMNQIKNIQKGSVFKKRFLLKKGDQYQYVNTKSIQYFYSDEGLTFLISDVGQQFIIDDKLDQLQQELDPNDFFRISRKFIIKDTAVAKIHSYFNSRLKLELNPSTNLEVIVSREKVPSFKAWLNS